MQYGVKKSLPLLQPDQMLWLATGLAAVFGASVVYLVDPRVPGNYPPCLFLYLTGCYCPGCGTLRALHRVLSGDLRGAMGYNPLAVLMLPVLIGVSINGAVRSLGRPLLPDFRVSHWLAWGMLAVVVLFWALRNVPVYPFSVLAP